MLFPSGVFNIGGFASTTPVVTVPAIPPVHTSNAKSTTAVAGT
ncbi:hypothetical protein [Bacillus thuringiensis]